MSNDVDQSSTSYACDTMQEGLITFVQQISTS